MDQNFNLPLVSIIITSYNRAPWIGQAIESALAQDYPNLEIIISDNCSTDNSDEVIKSYCHDPRIKYSGNDTNIGMIPNLQKAFFELAKGEYLTNISSDDYLVNPRFIANAINIINRNENIAIVFGMQNSINEKTKIIGRSTLPGYYNIECKDGLDIFFDYTNRNYPSGGAVYSMGHLKKNNIYFSGWVMGDVEINLQLMLTGNIGFLYEVVYFARIHENNASSSFNGPEELANLYLNIYRYIYKKAFPAINNKKKLKIWLNKLIDKNIRVCLHIALAKKNRKILFSFNKLLFNEYRKEYLLFLVKHPKYIVKIILNK